MFYNMFFGHFSIAIFYLIAGYKDKEDMWIADSHFEIIAVVGDISYIIGPDFEESRNVAARGQLPVSLNVIFSGLDAFGEILDQHTSRRVDRNFLREHDGSDLRPQHIADIEMGEQHRVNDEDQNQGYKHEPYVINPGP